MKLCTFCRRISATDIRKTPWAQLNVCLPCTYTTPWTAAMTLKKMYGRLDGCISRGLVQIFNVLISPLLACGKTIIAIDNTGMSAVQG